MIIKERSLYRKFIDWWDKWRHKMNTNYGTKILGFWETDSRRHSAGFIIILFLFSLIIFGLSFMI